MIRPIAVHHEIPANPIGEDWICSDVHGEFQLLMELLVDAEDLLLLQCAW